MKTKIIYISGNEVFNMNDIRAAFEEVRLALGLGSDTVLFGVPVDQEDAGFCKCETENHTETIEVSEEIIPEPINEIIDETEIPESEIINEEIETTPKKRGRPRKEIVTQIVEEVVEMQEPIADEATEPEIDSEKIVPILSVLSADEEPDSEEVVEDIVEDVNEDVHEEIAQDIGEDIVEASEESSEPDLEKLLSEMTPLQEDIDSEPIVEEKEEQPEDSVDATLEQLATEFAATQDKISSESKSSSRGKIGKLRNILPFKQSKHKDQGFGDLFGWAGTAANDEDFSVPGFFTNIASKK